MNDEPRVGDEHRRKVENFRLQIRGDGEEERPEAISSYSDPREARRRASFPEGAALQRARLAHTLRDREKGRKNRRFFRFIWLSMVLLVSLLLAKYAVSGVNDMMGVGRQNVTVTVEIPKNATVDQVAQVLHRAGAVRDAAFFRLYATLTGAPKKFDGGSYKITAGMDYLALMHSIQSTKNRVDTVKITFTEGMNALEIAAKLEKSGVCSAKDAIEVIQSTKLDGSFSMLGSISAKPERYYRLEGYLFPDTYEFFKNEDPEQAVRKLVSNCNAKLTKQIRQKAAERGMTLDQTLTLASMIQAEAADKNDMYLVSSVFHNRLNSKTARLRRLDSDPTIYYPYRKKAAVPASLRSTYKSRYDTYSFEGLPPGPICSPGLEAVDAALNPASTRYYYFCHSEAGKAYYARTETQHLVNLKKAGLR